MKIFSGILGLIFFVLCVTFAVVNRESATVNLWPFDTRIEAPVALLTLGSLLFGVLAGAGIAWVGALKHRFTSRCLRNDIARLHAKLEQLQNSVRAQPTNPSLSMLAPPKPRRRFFRKPEP